MGYDFGNVECCINMGIADSEIVIQLSKARHGVCTRVQVLDLLIDCRKAESEN